MPGWRIITTDGHRLFDGTAGLWHANVGHAPPELAEAACAQMRRLETYHAPPNLPPAARHPAGVGCVSATAGCPPLPEGVGWHLQLWVKRGR